MNNVKSKMIGIAALAGAMASTHGAAAQQAQAATEYEDIPGAGTYWEERVAAPRDAFELTLGTAYTQGLGELEAGRDVDDTAGAGMSLDLGLSYRFQPRWSVGLGGAYQFYDAGASLENQNEMPMGATARVNATYHFQPFTRLDPWLKGAAGYRYLCECGQPGREAMLHGVDILAVQAGLDLRLDRQVALSPVIGADLNLFLWDRRDAIADPRLNTFLYAGAQARFDFGGSYVATEGVASR